MQRRAFSGEIKALSDKGKALLRLSPFVNKTGFVRVGGRIGNADVPFDLKHPIILPRQCKATEAIISTHQSIQHSGSKRYVV